jgi:hypothetical protein
MVPFRNTSCTDTQSVQVQLWAENTALSTVVSQINTPFLYVTLALFMLFLMVTLVGAHCCLWAFVAFGHDLPIRGVLHNDQQEEVTRF